MGRRSGTGRRRTQSPSMVVAARRGLRRPGHRLDEEVLRRPRPLPPRRLRKLPRRRRAFRPGPRGVRRLRLRPAGGREDHLRPRQRLPPQPEHPPRYRHAHQRDLQGVSSLTHRCRRAPQNPSRALVGWDFGRRRCRRARTQRGGRSVNERPCRDLYTPSKAADNGLTHYLHISGHSKRARCPLLSALFPTLSRLDDYSHAVSLIAAFESPLANERSFGSINCPAGCNREQLRR